ncbi:GGDEF domain-containing protein [Nocardia sp. CDC160]|uniref:GGDEF domain-containing protein n=1 Tax=Nocardia sp. CDC160 TaxID=3112166 RepID=UPI002DB71F08|nr:GGDEF domain-containing protein [Nocardia sp. CDC160]MEC3918363.1 GGDEF domain-containing protein [Nocardia sp. CDC160]
MSVRRMGTTRSDRCDREHTLRRAAEEYLKLLAACGYTGTGTVAAAEIAAEFLRELDRISTDDPENGSAARVLGAQLATDLPGLPTSSRFVGPLASALMLAAPPAPADVTWALHAGTAVAGYAESLAERALGEHETILRAAVAAREHRITELQDRLHHAATHDRLTGLPNRAVLEERILEPLSAAEPLALLVVDMDGFKQINDRHGHRVGDELLVAVAERLRAVTDPADCVCRYGGDEFVIATTAGEEAAERIAERILAEIARPFELSTGPVDIRASIGIATTGAGTRDAATLIHDADGAMYAAKADGGHRYRTR